MAGLGQDCHITPVLFVVQINILSTIIHSEWSDASMVVPLVKLFIPLKSMALVLSGPQCDYIK